MGKGGGGVSIPKVQTNPSFGKNAPYFGQTATATTDLAAYLNNLINPSLNLGNWAMDIATGGEVPNLPGMPPGGTPFPSNISGSGVPTWIYSPYGGSAPILMPVGGGGGAAGGGGGGAAGGAAGGGAAIGAPAGAGGGWDSSQITQAYKSLFGDTLSAQDQQFLTKTLSVNPQVAPYQTLQTPGGGTITIAQLMSQAGAGRGGGGAGGAGAAPPGTISQGPLTGGPLIQGAQEALQKEMQIAGTYAPGTDPQSIAKDRKSTRLNSSHSGESRMPSSA